MPDIGELYRSFAAGMRATHGKVLSPDAIVMGDSHGNDSRAAQILDDAIAGNGDAARATDLVEALAYRAELAGARWGPRGGHGRSETRPRSPALRG